MCAKYYWNTCCVTNRVSSLISFLQYSETDNRQNSHNLYEHPFIAEIPHNKYTNIRKHQLLPHLLGWLFLAGILNIYISSVSRAFPSASWSSASRKDCLGVCWVNVLVIVMDQTYGVTPVTAHKSSNVSLFGSLKRRDSRQSGKGSNGGSVSIKTKQSQVSRPPPGFVSYQIAPSDNISYDPRKYSSGLTNIRSHSQAYLGKSSKRDKSRAQSSYALAGVHPQHLHNGGRSHSPACSPGRTKYTGEGGKKYRKSPVPVLRSEHWAEEEELPHTESYSPDYTNSKPPLPPPPTLPTGYESNGNPKPPPRLRPKSWSSTLFNAFRLHSNKQSAPPLNREISTVTLSSLNTNTMEKKGFRSSFNKQVRFLANPSKPLDANQKFYSLPHFAKQPGLLPETVRPKARSRTPSPFGRFVKSFVKGNRGNQNSSVGFHIFMSTVLTHFFSHDFCFEWIIVVWFGASNLF